MGAILMVCIYTGQLDGVEGTINYNEMCLFTTFGSVDACFLL